MTKKTAMKWFPNQNLCPEKRKLEIIPDFPALYSRENTYKRTYIHHAFDTEEECLKFIIEDCQNAIEDANRRLKELGEDEVIDPTDGINEDDPRMER